MFLASSGVNLSRFTDGQAGPQNTHYFLHGVDSSLHFRGLWIVFTAEGLVFPCNPDLSFFKE